MSTKILTPGDLGAGFVLNPQTNQYETAYSSLQGYRLNYGDAAKAPNVNNGTSAHRRMLVVQNGFGYAFRLQSY